jgi:hypothetical protein
MLDSVNQVLTRVKKWYSVTCSVKKKGPWCAAEVSLIERLIVEQT